jgi:hypothetical protein
VLNERLTTLTELAPSPEEVGKGMGSRTPFRSAHCGQGRKDGDALV